MQIDEGCAVRVSFRENAANMGSEPAWGPQLKSKARCRGASPRVLVIMSMSVTQNTSFFNPHRSHEDLSSSLHTQPCLY